MVRRSDLVRTLSLIVKRYDVGLALCELGGRFELYVVGGFIRDTAFQLFYHVIGSEFKLKLKGNSRLDLDLIVHHENVNELLNNLPQPLKRVVLGDEFGDGTTFRLIYPELQLDVTTFDDLERDLLRRDFTLNSIAVRLAPEFCSVLGRTDSEFLIDPFGGVDDISSGRLRVVRETNIADDPIRILRALRFTATFPLKLSPETVSACISYVHKLREVNLTRLSQELLKWLSGPLLGASFRYLSELGLDLVLLGRKLEADELEALTITGLPPISKPSGYLVLLSALSADDGIVLRILPKRYKRRLSLARGLMRGDMELDDEPDNLERLARLVSDEELLPVLRYVSIVRGDEGLLLGYRCAVYWWRQVGNYHIYNRESYRRFLCQVWGKLRQDKEKGAELYAGWREGYTMGA